MLWSIFTYTITHHGLGGFSGLINGLIAAAIGALSMLTSEPTAKSNVKRTRMFDLSFSRYYATLHYIKERTGVDANSERAMTGKQRPKARGARAPLLWNVRSYWRSCNQRVKTTFSTNQ